MIAVRLMGGLGNQMFQYAIGRKLALEHSTDLVMDLIFFENIAKIDTPRHYELDCFTINEKFLSPAKRPVENPQSTFAGRRGKLQLIKHRLVGQNWQVYYEPHHNFDPKALKLPDNSYLIGYWQTEKYFADSRDIILKDFSFKQPAKGKNAELLNQIKNSESISIHVRRGDYVTNKHASKFHGTKELSYYNTALSHFLKQTNNPTLFVFSDEPEWCKNNLKFKQKTVYVEGNKKGYEDMRLMMNCRHNIIANSSFSWWAAWLNQNPDKLVAAPKQWFNDSSVNTKDVIPESWIKI